MTVSQAEKRASAARQAHREDRRRVVLDAAERLVSELGLVQFSMRMLAKETGIPAPTLYGYFESKEAVLCALTDRKIAILSSYILREAERAEPGIGRLMAFARGYRRFARESQDYYDLFIGRSSIAGDGNGQDIAIGPGIGLIRTLAADVAVAIERGEIPPVDAERLIVGLWTAAHGYLSLELRNVLPEWVIPPGERDMAYERYFEAMLRGYRMVDPEPGTLREAG